MTQTTKAITTKGAAATAVIVYGMNAQSKPLGALFPTSLYERAIKAAEQLKLKLIRVTTTEIAEVAKRLPIGRINSSGKGFVPAVRQPLYDQILKVANGAPPTAVRPATTPAADTSNIPLNEARKAGNPVATTEGLPKSWKDIGPNHLVLVQESLQDGWWEALVVARDKDMLTVRWRNYPNWKPFPVHVDAVALMNAAPSFKV